MDDVTDPVAARAVASAEEFRAFLKEIGESQSSFARVLKRIGDDREKATIVRHVQRMATGEARISGEMRVIMAIFRNSRRKRAQKADPAPDQQRAG